MAGVFAGLRIADTEKRAANCERQGFLLWKTRKPWQHNGF
jgi:hypothetical protein